MGLIFLHAAAAASWLAATQMISAFGPNGECPQGALGCFSTNAPAVTEGIVQQFELLLQSSGDPNPAAGAQVLRNDVSLLVATGSTEEQAFSVVFAITKFGRINLPGVITVAVLARDIAAVRQDAFQYSAVKLTQALSSNITNLTDYIYFVEGPNGLAASEAAEMRRLAEKGQSPAAISKALAQLQARFGGGYEKLGRPALR